MGTTNEIKVKVTAEDETGLIVRKMPDYPPMAIIALVGSVVSTAVAFGLDVTPEQRAAIEDLMRNLVAVGIADYLLRMVRNATR